MKMKLTNYMEDAVDHMLPSVLDAYPDICTCEHCLLDIKAIALNHLHPHYVVTEKGKLYSQLEEMKIQFETDIIKALIDAIAIVSENPRHDIEF